MIPTSNGQKVWARLVEEHEEYVMTPIYINKNINPLLKHINLVKYWYTLNNVILGIFYFCPLFVAVMTSICPLNINL